MASPKKMSLNFRRTTDRIAPQRNVFRVKLDNDASRARLAPAASCGKNRIRVLAEITATNAEMTPYGLDWQGSPHLPFQVIITAGKGGLMPQSPTSPAICSVGVRPAASVNCRAGIGIRPDRCHRPCWYRWNPVSRQEKAAALCRTHAWRVKRLPLSPRNTVTSLYWRRIRWLYVGSRILGKPETRDQAAVFLRLLSEATASVMTAVA